jgi:hypothetical protein
LQLGRLVLLLLLSPREAMHPCNTSSLCSVLPWHCCSALVSLPQRRLLLLLLLLLLASGCGGSRCAVAACTIQLKLVVSRDDGSGGG